jgi:hypothetical protein
MSIAPWNFPNNLQQDHRDPWLKMAKQRNTCSYGALIKSARIARKSVKQPSLVKAKIRSVITAFSLAAACPAMGQAAEANDGLWTTSQEAEAFCQALPLVGEPTLKAALGDYFTTFTAQAGLNVSKLRELDYPHMASVLDRAITKQWSVLDLIADQTLLQSSPCAFFLDQATLQQVDAHYDLHSLWMLNAPVGSDQVLAMSYLMFGDGKLVLGYPRTATVMVQDYKFFTGNYDYPPYLTADIMHNNAARGLLNIRVRQQPLEKAGNFIGPFNSKIEAVLLYNDNVEVSYLLFDKASTKVVPNLKIEKR